MQATTIDTEAVDAAHRAIRADHAIQFDFPWRVVEARETPEWLAALGHAIDAFFRALGPFWQVVFWVIVAGIAILIAFTLVPPLREWLRARLRPAADAAVPAEWHPAPPASRALLAEAERLAASGRFDAAVRLLLHRSIADIEAWHAGIVRPASTARDIAAAPAIPVAARTMFARLVGLTERAFFARQPLDADDWHAAREAYRAFAL